MSDEILDENYFIVFIHGLLGSSLLKGNEVIWPPSNVETVKLCFSKLFNVDNYINDLADKNLVSGQVLPNYDNVIGLIKKMSHGSYYIFSYDWRQSFNEITDKFEKDFENLHINEKNVILIGHSAGGLISYLYTNDRKYDKEENINRTKIKKIISLGSPFQGSLKALSIALGLYDNGIFNGKEFQDILNKINIKTVFDLIPTNINNSFYNSNGSILNSNEIFNILLNHGYTKEHLDRAISFRNNFNALEHNDKIDYTLIVGSFNKSNVCTGFTYNEEEKTLVPEYSNSCSDGSVIFNEAVLDTNKKHKIKYVNCKHQFLTECDESLEIIENEISNTGKEKFNIVSYTLSENEGVLKFKLFIISKNHKYEIKDLKAESIVFTSKTKTEKITNTIKKNKNKNYFYFKTNLNYGMLKFKNLLVYYLDDELNERNMLFRKKFVELERYNNKIIFF